MSGVALKLLMYGGCPSRQRFGSSLLSWSKIKRELAQTSPRPGIVRLTNPSADCQRQAIASLLKLVASICVSGAYFVAPRSPAYVLHSPPVAPCWARIGPTAIAIAADDDTTTTRRSQRAFMAPPLHVLPLHARAQS